MSVTASVSTPRNVIEVIHSFYIKRDVILTLHNGDITGSVVNLVQM